MLVYIHVHARILGKTYCYLGYGLDLMGWQVGGSTFNRVVGVVAAIVLIVYPRSNN